MKRRTFLTQLSTAAGFALLAPWGRQALASGTAPRRFVFVVEGNSFDPAMMMSAVTRSAIASQATGDVAGRRSFATRYGHSEPLVIQEGELGTAPGLSSLSSDYGLDLLSKSSVTLGLSSTITGGGHSTFFGGLSSSRSTPNRAGGPTIDALLASHSEVRGETPFDAVRVGVHASHRALNNTTCANLAGRPLPVIMDTELAYAKLFGSVADAAGQAAFERRADLLDYAKEDVSAALSTFAGNSSERAKLESYLASLEALQRRQGLLAGMSSTLSELVPDGPEVNSAYRSDCDLERLAVQFELTTAALLGGLTNVAVIASGTGGHFDLNYSSLGTNTRRHNLHHGWDNGSNLSYIQAATRRHVEMIAKMARALAAVPEEGGTMLDNTVIVFLSDNGETHHSYAVEFPVLMVGGQAMGLKNDGRSTVFPGVNNSNNRQLSNFYNTLGHAAGMNLNDFGTEGASRLALGPLSELLA